MRRWGSDYFLSTSFSYVHVHVHVGMQLTIVEESICTVYVRKNVVKLHRYLLCNYVYIQYVILVYVYTCSIELHTI